MIPSASIRRSARTIILVLLLTTPFLLGTPPTEPCNHFIVTGRIIDASSMPMDGARLSLEVKRKHYGNIFSDDEGLGHNQERCPDDFPGPILIDTTDNEGGYLLRGGIEFFENTEDSLRLVVRLTNDSIVYGEPFAMSDTTSTTPIYVERMDNPMSGSGCSCSGSPVIGGYIYRFEERDVVVP